MYFALKKHWIYESKKHRCTGVELALLGGALGLAGTGTQIYAGQKEKQAMNAAAQAEIQRQAQFQKQGQAALAQHLSESSPQAAGQDISGGAQKYGNEYNKLAAIPLTTSSAASPVVSNAQSDANVSAKNTLANQASAGLQGYTDWGLKNAIDTLKAQTKLGQINTFARQSENVLPYELQAAQNSQQGLSGLGSLLGTAGGLIGLYGLTMPAAGAANAAAGGLSSSLPVSQAQLDALAAGMGPVTPAAGMAASPFTTGAMATQLASKASLFPSYMSLGGF